MGLVLSQAGLDISIDACRKKGLKRQGKELQNMAKTSAANLKSFWRKQPIGRESFQAICYAIGVDWRDVIDRHKSSQNDFAPIKSWEGIPAIPPVYGRTEDLRKVIDSIVKYRCRIFMIYGARGVGKTTVAVKVAEEIEAYFDYIMFYPLASSPPLEEVLTDIFTFLGRNSKLNFHTRIGDNLRRTTDNPEITANISEGISQLIKFLNQHRCLIVLDGLEAVLSSGNYAGSYRKEHLRYRELMQRLGEEPHKSCLLVTSHEQPTEIAPLKQKHNFVCAHELKGLAAEAAQRILQEKYIFDEDKFNKLNQIYQGNPLLLKVIMSFIVDVCGGSVKNFLRQNTFVTRCIALILQELFDRLSSRENDVVNELKQHTKPVSIDLLRENLRISSNELMMALQSLVSRSLVEKTTGSSEDTSGYTLPPLIKEYAEHQR